MFKQRGLARVLPALCAGLFSCSVLAGEGEGDLRGMKLGRFVEARPQGKSGGTKSLDARFRRQGLPLPAGAVATDDAAIGVTIWRLRLSKDSDPSATREILHGKKASTYTPERIGAPPELTLGEMFRLGIETPHEGYLYVVDRSRYAAGTKRPAYLIFPTSRLRNGDNRVFGGRLTQLPGGKDEPPYFELGGGPGLEAEELTVLVTPQPLEMKIEEDRVPLTDAQLEEWERRWAAPVEQLDMVGGAGLVVSVAEKNAGAKDARLTKDDPVPQTVYRIAAKPQSPLFLRVTIRVKPR